MTVLAVNGSVKVLLEPSVTEVDLAGATYFLTHVSSSSLAPARGQAGLEADERLRDKTVLAKLLNFWYH